MARAMARWWRVALAALLVLLGLGGVRPAPVGAATCVVTSAADGGAGTLRAHVADAGCDAITFAAGLGAVTLASRIDVGRGVVIDGPGQVVQRTNPAAAANGGLFWVTSGTVVLRGLTLQGGRTDGTSGGGLTISGGNVTLDGATLRDNVARNAGGGGGIYASNATLRLTNTVVRDNLADNTVYNDARGGGGLLIDVGYGSVNVTIEGGSQILNNQVTGDNGGGGIKLWSGVAGRTATLTLTDATVSGNTTTGSGGGLVNIGGTATLTATTISGNNADSGGGLYNLDGTATLTNTTVSANSAHDAGGLYNFRGTATLTNATVTGNIARTAGLGGGGIKTAGSSINPATTQLRASIIAGNSGSTGSEDCASANLAYAPLTSQGYNVVGTTTGCPSNGTGDATHGGALAALLTPTLADNGGPTKTHDLPVGSPAIDRVPAAGCPATDQRGIPRPQPTGGNCDSGAVERVVLTTLTLATVGAGSVGRAPAGSGGGPFAYPLGTVVTLTPQPGVGQTFAGWTVDGVPQGWPNPLTITMNTAHTVVATFAPTAAFPDVPATRPDFVAIRELASRGTIKGYQDGTYGPDDKVRRDQMAALIARAMPQSVPAGSANLLVPPACLVAGSWDCEDWGNNFSDGAGVDANLWRNAGTLQHYGVSIGYSGATCAAKQVPSPCYGPGDRVTYAQTISFITRAMKAKGYWTDQPGAPLPYSNVPTAHQLDVRTFHFYVGGIPAAPGTTAGWEDGATRGWFARALWAALDSYWRVDRVP